MKGGVYMLSKKTILYMIDTYREHNTKKNHYIIEQLLNGVYRIWVKPINDYAPFKWYGDFTEGGVKI